MNREKVFDYVKENYDIEPEQPWDNYPNYRVLRHSDNDKWFALIMDVDKEKVGLDGEERIDVLDVKYDSNKIQDVKKETGITDGYHMDKDNWISIILDSGISEGKIQSVIDNSFELTA